MSHQPSTISHSPSAIYVHIPFCLRKCFYCDFASFPGKEHLYEPYVEALREEIRLGAERYPEARISTIYLGGGTPNVLTPEQLGSILEQIRQSFQVCFNAEITTEANPGGSLNFQLPTWTPQHPTPDTQHLEFNRLSLGVQSFHNNELGRLGRIHTADEAVGAFLCAREAGFRNISIDLMYGIPEQTLDSWGETLRRAIELGSEHISLYSLTVEEGTPFHEMWCEGRLEIPGNDIEADMYEAAIEMLTSAGFIHYEISNFAKPGFESRHNTTYWRNEPYFGFGAGAASYLNGVRALNVSEVEEYICRMKNGEIPIESQESLTGCEAMGETMFLGLRMLRGVHKTDFAARYGVSPQEVFPEEILSLTARGLIEESGEYIRLTRTGLLLANEVFSAFVS